MAIDLQSPAMQLIMNALSPGPAQSDPARAARGEPSKLPASKGKKSPAIGFASIPNMQFLGARGLLGPAATSPNFSTRSSQLLSEAGSTNTAAQIGAFDAARLGPILELLTSSLFGGGSGLPGREDLLNPRLADIRQTAQTAEDKVANFFGGLGRSITSTPAQKSLTEISGAAQKERQRATGDVDTLLSQLLTNRMGVMGQIIAALLGGAR